MEWRSLNHLISELKAEASPGSFRHLITLTGPNWHRVRDMIEKIHDGFRDVRYPTKEDRDRAWARFMEAKAEAHSRRGEEEEALRHRSAEHRSSILRLVERARPGFLTSPDADTLKALGRHLSKAGKSLSDHKDEMIASHKHECFEAITATREQLDKWWKAYHADSAERHRRWKARVTSNLEQNREQLSKALAALARHEDHAAELRSKIASAWNSDWAARASGWLAETEDKIDDIRSSVRRLEGWVAEDESNLS